MDINYPSSETIENVGREFGKKKTLKDQFEVVWKLTAPHIQNPSDVFEKSVDESRMLREIGNRRYADILSRNSLSQSIEAYTRSIAYAPVGSNELSLAYANRSAVLYKARLYDDCLVDIERALKSGYPDNLKTKLYVRQALCFKSLEPNSDDKSNASMASAMQWLPNLKKNNPNYNIQDEYSKMLSKLKKPRKIIHFSPKIKNVNSIIVGASDAIELKKTNKDNQHIVATKNIKTGEFIYINEPFAVIVNDEKYYTNCWHCSCQTWSGIPCDNCPNIIYCSDQCKKKAWDSYHNIECQLFGPLTQFDRIDDEKILTIKILSKALTSAGGLDKLKKKIDNINSIKNEELILTNGILDVNTVDNFHRLGYYKITSNEFKFELTLLAVWIVIIFGERTNILGRKMTVNELIDDEKVLILGELFMRYLMISHLNFQSFLDTSNGDCSLSTMLIPISKKIKNSCDPNIDFTILGSNIGIYASKPIKQGESLYLSIGGQYHTKAKDSRNAEIFFNPDDFKPCTCRACDRNWPTLSYLPSYQNMKLPTDIENELDYMMEKLKSFENIVDIGSSETLLSIKDHLNPINDKIHQYLTAPCRELSISYVMVKTLYGRLHTLERTLE